MFLVLSVCLYVRVCLSVFIHASICLSLRLFLTASSVLSHLYHVSVYVCVCVRERERESNQEEALSALGCVLCVHGVCVCLACVLFLGCVCVVCVFVELV